MKLVKVNNVEYLYAKKFYPHLIFHCKWGDRQLKILLEFEKFTLSEYYIVSKNNKLRNYGMLDTLEKLRKNYFKYYTLPRQYGRSLEALMNFTVSIAEFNKVTKNKTTLSEYLKEHLLHELEYNYQREVVGKWMV